MPATKPRNQGKTSFVKEFLHDNPFGNTKAVNEAWTKEGMKGTISETLVNKMRSHLGLAGNLRGRRRANQGAARSAKGRHPAKKRGPSPKGSKAMLLGSTAAHRASRRKADFIELETEMDRLLFRVMNLENLGEVEATIRDARRLLYQAFTAKR
jgi:hypothetical protein